MEIDLDALLRPNIRNLKPYSSARDEFSGKSEVLLDANENPFGSVGIDENYNRYPDPHQRALKELIAKREGLSPEHIFLGNGSDEPIDLIMRAFGIPGQDNVLTCPPTYGMYSVSARINDLGLREIPLVPGFQLALDNILSLDKDSPKLFFLCSPNNPSGNPFRAHDLVQIIENYPGIFVLDEAYIDFCPQLSQKEQLKKHKNLIILRTFSKAWGMAGLRLGIALAHPEIVSVLDRIKPPYNINSYTQAKAKEALLQESEMKRRVGEILMEKDQLEEALSKLPLVKQIYPSQTNFVLVKFPEAKALYNYLVSQKIIVRDRSKVYLCDNCLRITVGNSQENAELIQAIQTYGP